MVTTHKDIKSGIYNKGAIKFEEVMESIKFHHNIKECGSILTFTGIVRNTSENGKSVIGLKIDSYDELSNNTINTICSELRREKGIIDVKIIHFKGDFKISEELVYVIVASAHRKEGFDILRKAVERYKKELTVWKKELFIEGNSEWIH